MSFKRFKKIIILIQACGLLINKTYFKYFVTCIAVGFALSFTIKMSNSFLNNQLSYPRVEQAYKEKYDTINQQFNLKQLTFPPSKLYIRAFKHEKQLEIWVEEENYYRLYKSYEICNTSGVLGPKRKEGDHQIPEGIYEINVFNPWSNFHLSLGINYPNKADLYHADKQKPGNDIYIHGNCVTIGCLPMTDDKMKEIYLLAVLAKTAGQENIPVHIYPYRFSMLKDMLFKTKYPQHQRFWETLKPYYNYFNENKTLKTVQIINGTYQ